MVIIIMGYIGYIKGIMEKNMETTMTGLYRIHIYICILG